MVVVTVEMPLACPRQQCGCGSVVRGGVGGSGRTVLVYMVAFVLLLQIRARAGQGEGALPVLAVDAHAGRKWSRRGARAHAEGPAGGGTAAHVRCGECGAGRGGSTRMMR